MEKFTHWFHKHERHISSGALVLGFIIDNLTLRRVDLLAENLLLFAYIVLAGGGIVIMHAYSDEKWRRYIGEKFYLFIPAIVQFVFGGLFSAFFVFYSRSGSFSASWPFIIMLGVLLVGNEFLRQAYSRLKFQLSVFYVTVFSYLIFVVPIIIKRIDIWSFIISGFASLIVMAFLIQLLLRISSPKVREERKSIRIYIVSIFVFINILYFTNSIPPIPLSLQDVGVYHEVSKEGGVYNVIEEKQNYWKRFLGIRVHINSGEELYVWSSVFAPTKINANIVHRWQYYDNSKKGWVDAGTIRFPITGGRDGGYRGYSVKQIKQFGDWRVDVENERGQIIGRISFEVVDNPVNVELIKKVK